MIQNMQAFLYGAGEFLKLQEFRRAFRLERLRSTGIDLRGRTL